MVARFYHVRAGTLREAPALTLHSFRDPSLFHRRDKRDILLEVTEVLKSAGYTTEITDDLPQSKSKPSNLFCLKNLIAFLTSWLLRSELATKGENLELPSFQPVEYFVVYGSVSYVVIMIIKLPPIASMVFKFLLYVFKPVNLAYPPKGFKILTFNTRCGR